MSGDFTFPIMPGAWWAVAVLLIFARVHFGKDVYVAYRLFGGRQGYW